MPKIIRLVSRHPDIRQDIVDKFILAKNMATSRVENVRFQAQARLYHLRVLAPQITPYIAAVQQNILAHDPSHGVRLCAHIEGQDIREQYGKAILKLHVPYAPSITRLKSSLDALPLPPSRRTRLASHRPRQ